MVVASHRSRHFSGILSDSHPEPAGSGTIVSISGLGFWRLRGMTSLVWRKPAAAMRIAALLGKLMLGAVIALAAAMPARADALPPDHPVKARLVAETGSVVPGAT